MTDLDRIREVLQAHSGDGAFLLAVAYLAVDSMTSDERGRLKYVLATAGNTGPRQKVLHKDDSPLPVRVRRTPAE